MPACEIGIPRRHWRWWDAFLVRADPEAWCSKPASVLVGRVRSNALQARSRDAPSLARVEGFATCLDPQDGVTVRGKRCGAPGAALDDPAVCGASSPRAEALGIALRRTATDGSVIGALDRGVVRIGRKTKNQVRIAH